MTGESADKGLTYRDAGVNIDAGDALVAAIKPLAMKTRRPGADAKLGGFGGVFDIKAAGYTDPLLVAATDGVGTKLGIAVAAGLHKTIGIDLVAMCVNDLIVQGAEPLFFLDYMATGKLDVDQMRDVVAGIAEGCAESGAALIGGETAEMPGLYKAGDYDLAGFAVGAVERGHILDASRVAAGDRLLGLASSGPHSNGYSLIRKIVEKSGLSYADPAPFAPEDTLGERLLTPTRLYVKSCLAAVRSEAVHALAHITGGGFLENIPRILPAGLSAHIDANTWPLPRVFDWLQKTGGLSTYEMARTFNCGIGMVVVVRPDMEQVALRHLEEQGERVYLLGDVRETDGPSVCHVTGGAGIWGSSEPWALVTGQED